MKILIGAWYVLVIIAILAIFLYDNVNATIRSIERFTLDKYFEDPQKYGNKKAEHMVKIINVSQDHFYIELNNKDIKVMGSGIQRPLYGETVVFLNYRKDGIIELIDYHNYNYNYFLYGMSIVAVLVFAIIFSREWKITKGGFKDA